MLSAINENRCKSSHWPTKSAVIIMVTVKMLQFTTDVFNVTNKKESKPQGLTEKHQVTENQ